MLKKIIYISDLSLPSNKAQAVHIFKLLDNFLQFSDKAILICPNLKKKIQKGFFKKYFNLHSNKDIEIHNLFKKAYSNSFLRRLIFGLKVGIKLRNENNLIISRSLISSFILSLFRVKHFIEIHQEIKGLTKFLLINLNFINSKYITKVIFISNNLSKFFDIKDNNFIILHDACDLKDFRERKKLRKKIKKIFYVGSFYKGRGIDIIQKLSKLTPDLDYYLYGLRDEKISSSKNFKVHPVVSYRESVNLIKSADLLLMPYQTKVSINSDNFNDDISQFISPLKMFEYLATGIPIISSDLKVLREILKDQKNSVLVKNYTNPFAWKKAILSLSNNYSLRNYISKNSLATAEKNTWKKRSEKIHNIYLKKIKND